MTSTMAVVDQPSKLHSIHGSLHEPLAKDVAYILLTAFSLAGDDAGREDVCLRILRFCNELTVRSLVFAGAVITLLCRDQSWRILPPLVRTARKHKSDPAVSPFLLALKARLLVGNRSEANELLRDCEVKAGVWQGLTLEEIMPYLQRYGIAPGNKGPTVSGTF